MPMGATFRTGRPARSISNLANRGTLLLNYRLGDYARFAQGACPCGRTLRRLEGLEGRVAEVLRLGNGFVHQYAIWHALTAIDDLVNFQLVQLKRRRFEPASSRRRARATSRSQPSRKTARARPPAWVHRGRGLRRAAGARASQRQAAADRPARGARRRWLSRARGPKPRRRSLRGRAAGPRAVRCGEAAGVVRAEGLRSLWTRALGETFYRRLIRSSGGSTPNRPFAMPGWSSTSASRTTSDSQPPAPGPGCPRSCGASTGASAAMPPATTVESWRRAVATGSVRIPYLARSLDLADGDVFVYEAYTAPDYRRLGIAHAVESRLTLLLREEGHRRILRTVLPENAAGVEMHTSLGNRPIGTIGYVKIGLGGTTSCG